MAKIELPPKSFKDDIQLTTIRWTDDKKRIFEGARESIMTDLTKYNADKTFITLGVSSKYTVGSSHQTLYKSNQFKFSSIIRN